ncbi:Gti1/Pac2 family-domain-containing protein, partial [Lentinula edodes]
VETTGDALLILEAARRGWIPRVTRRLVDSERQMITSGSVFVFDEEGSGIKRWTDGFFWSPSRILGNCLLYRDEINHLACQSVKSGEDSIPHILVPASIAPHPYCVQSKQNPPASVDKITRSASLNGAVDTSTMSTGGGGLAERLTFSLSFGGVAQPLISYYRVEDVENGRLRSPSSLPELASLDISPEYLDETHFRNPPKVEVGPDGVPRYRGEADDI